MRKLSFLCIMLACAASGVPALAQVDADYQKYPDYSPRLKPDHSLLRKAVRMKGLSQRPDHVNNAQTPFFPPVFNQDGGSCGSASRIGYMFNYEINAYRGANGQLEENQYPTHFTWLLTNSNSGKETMAAANGIPNVPTYGGRTYSKLFGNQDTADPDFGWMQGYDKWYSAMFNRITSNGNFPMSVATEEGREAVKNWLWNHNGDPDFKAGGVCGIGVASGGTWVKIPKTNVNDSIGVTNMYYVGAWGKQVDHALTIVGYDDRIEFDLDGNGIAGEKDKDEVGAWIVVNSWGASWCNQGFIYCPYKNAVTTGNSNDYYWPEVYYVRKNYRPLRTFKILMEYSKRSELRISGGISADLTADKPEKMVNFEHFKFAGDGDGNGVDAEVPMLGRWADGMHYEPMEFGYDLTDLSASFDTRRPLKYFLVIETKATASGKGKVDRFSAIDYEFDKDGVEFPANIAANGVEIKNAGQTTYISVILPGEPFNAPQNLQWQGNELAWSAPVNTPYELKNYLIYRNDTLLARTNKNELTYSPQDNASSYTVSALYQYGDTTIESARSNATAGTFQGNTPTINYVRTFSNGGFNIVDVFSQKYDKATIEFWYKPDNVKDWNMQIGPAWGKFMMHTTSKGELVAGWDTNNRLTSAANTLRPGTWAHIAVVANKGDMTAYVNGRKVGSVSTGYSGLGGFGDLNVGIAGQNGLNGQMDELRIWSCARSQQEIQQYMYSEISNPSSMPNLLAEVSMNEATGEKLTDRAQGHVIEPLGNNAQNCVTDFMLLRDTRTLSASFQLPEGPYEVGMPINVKNTSSGNAVKWSWHAENSNVLKAYVESPVITFNKTGMQAIQLTAYNAKGDSAVFKDTIQVQEQAPLTADFKIYPDTVAAGENISLINLTSPSTGCTYKWDMPEATTTESTLTNTSTHYLKAGRYEITLTATNAKGSSTVKKTVTVTEQSPSVAFSISPNIVLKGNTFKLTDESLYAPTAWQWQIKNNGNCVVVNEQNPSLSIDEPGVYQVALTAENGKGSNTATKERGLIVCNADGQNGLNFYGNGESVSFRNPLAQNDNSFTIEWWMYAKKNSASCHQIGKDEQSFLIKTNENGSMSVSLGGQTVTTQAGVVKESEWHHYAVSYTGGNLRIFKDAELILTQSLSHSSANALPETFTIGGAEAPMNAVIDELRIWNKALAADDFKTLSNQPITDVSAAASQGLKLYYPFNQSSGDVTDATPNKNDGKRSGFGPEGDAWSSSLGIFCLSANQAEDITSKYLVNTIQPFNSTGKTVNNSNASRFVGLADWTVENVLESSGATTGIHVDKQKNSAMTLTTTWDGFASSIYNHMVFQTIELPAGFYRFSVQEYQEFASSGSYLAVAHGKGLPQTTELDTKALAYAPLANKKVEFIMPEDGEISVGMVFNLSGQSCITFKKFTLEKLAFRQIGEPTISGLECIETTEADRDIQLHVTGQEVHISTLHPERVRIYNLSGACIFNQIVSGSHTLSLPSGIYLANGQKLLIP